MSICDSMDDGVVSEIREQYSHYTARRLLFIAIFAVVLVFMSLISITVGTRNLSIEQVYALLIDHLQGAVYDRTLEYDLWYDDNIVWNYRLPRVIFAIIAGASLSVAGATMQSVMKNPLADPYTTGISSGALLGVAVAMVLGFVAGKGGIDSFGLVLNAMTFAMIPVMTIYFLSPILRKSPATLILAGTAVSYLFNSVTDILLVSTDDQTLADVYRWQVGSLADLSWDAIPLPLFSCVVGSLILFCLSHKMNLMSLDDADAKSLGLDSEQLRLVCLVLLSFIAASVISYSGGIGFVGLIVPHMVRLLLGADNRFVIPASFITGATFLLFCDIVSRLLDVSAAIPVGVVTALFGSPIFLFLILRNKREVW